MLTPEVRVQIDLRETVKVKVHVGRTKAVESECAGAAAAMREAASDARRLAATIIEVAQGLEERAAEIDSKQ